MSAIISGLVWRHFPARDVPLLVVGLALADHAHDDGTHIYPSVETLTAKTRLAKRTVQACLSHLRSCGWLVVEKWAPRPGLTTVYRISPAWVASDGREGVDFGDRQAKPMDAPAAPIADEPMGAADCAMGAADCAMGAARYTLTIKETSMNLQ